MFCPRCQLRITGEPKKGVCPYCGAATRHVHDEPPAAPAREAPAPASAAKSGDSTRTEVPRDDPFATGRIVAGKYEVLHCLGTGGFGTVYKVRHARRRKLYALKIPREEFLDRDTFRIRFEREIEAMERFVHPDAVMIRDSGVTEDGTPYYTMDFIEGESLRVVLRREGTLAVGRAIDIARHVLRVLEVAHAHQIIHRDIKPDNVLLTVSDGREAVKVVDFGVAKLLDIVDSGGSITGAQPVGTPAYMSPELITGAALDARSDLFSVGILLYEMLTGKHPFAYRTRPSKVTEAILGRDPEPPSAHRAEIDRQLDDLVLALLAKRPRSRPAGTAPAIAALDAVAGGLACDAPHSVAVAVIETSARRPAVPLVLRENAPGGERRRFLFFTSKVSFGRSGRADGVADHLILRRLPCRSAAADPGSWNRNLTISHLAGTLSVDGRLVLVDADPSAASGIGIGGLEQQRGARLGSDRFHLTLGDHALELDGTRFVRGGDVPALDLSAVRREGVSEPHDSSSTGYSDPMSRLDCVRLLRADNWPLHEYYLVERIVRIGSAATVPIRLRARGVRAVHAAILFEGGESFLLALSAKVAIRGLHSSGGQGSMCGLELEPHEMAPLVPGLTVAIGDTHWTVSAVEDDDFKRV